MEKPRRKPGRPKATARTTPLVLEAALDVARIELELPATTVKALAEYAAWVGEWADITHEEATVKTADFGLREVFRRDRLWQEHRKNPDARESSPPSAASQPPGPALPPSLPPPAGATTKVAPSLPTPVGRR